MRPLYERIIMLKKIHPDVKKIAVVAAVHVVVPVVLTVGYKLIERKLTKA